MSLWLNVDLMRNARVVDLNVVNRVLRLQKLSPTIVRLIVMRNTFVRKAFKEIIITNVFFKINVSVIYHLLSVRIRMNFTLLVVLFIGQLVLRTSRNALNHVVEDVIVKKV